MFINGLTTKEEDAFITDYLPLYDLLDCAEIRKIFKELIDYAYVILPERFDSLYRASVMHIAVEKFKAAVMKRAEESGIADQVKAFIKKHEHAIKVMQDQNDWTDTIMSKEHFTTAEAYKLNRMNEESPIPLTDIDPSFRLYHGTDFPRYQNILKEGAIKPDQTFGENGIHDEGMVFFSDSLDNALTFSLLDYYSDDHWSSDFIKDDRVPGNREHLMTAYSDGAIFVLNPAGYDIFYYPSRQEFTVRGEVQVKDCNIILTHSRNGVITMEGADDLHYE